MSKLQLLTAMVILTWRIHLVINIHQAKREQLAQTIHRRIDDAGWRAALVLARRNSPQVGVDVFQSKSNELLDEMRAWNTEIQSLASARAEQTDSLVAAAGHFRTVASDLSGLTRDAKGSFDIMISIVTHLGDRIVALEQQQGQVERALTGVAPTLREHATSTEQVLTAHAAAIRASLADNASEVQRVLSQNTESVQAGLEAYNESVQAGLEAYNGSVQAGLEKHSGSVQAGLEKHSESVQAGLEKYGGVIAAGVGELTTTARGFHQGSERALAATESIAESISQIDGVLAQLQDSTARSLQDGSDQLSRAVASVAGRLTELQQLLDRQQAATAQLVRQGSQEIASAASAVGTAVTRIEGSVTALERRVGDERQAFDLAATAARSASEDLHDAIRATTDLTHGVNRTAQQVADLSEPLAGIEQRLQDLTDGVTSSTGSMARSVNAFAGGAADTRERLDDAAGGLAEAAQRLSALLHALEQQAQKQTGIRLGAPPVIWWNPRTWSRRRR